MFHRLQLLGFNLNFGHQWFQGRCIYNKNETVNSFSLFVTDLIEHQKSGSRVSVGMGNAGWECLWRPLKAVQAQIRIILEQVA